MKYNNGSNEIINKKKKQINQNSFVNQQEVLYINVNNDVYLYNNNNNKYNNKIKKNNLRNSVSMPNNSKNISSNFPKKNFGISQKNFYNNTNNLNIFPSIQYQRPNLNSINDNWLHYSHQQQKIYSDLFNNMAQKYPNNNKKENFARIFDFDYKRPEEKLKKGQNQLILERLQKKYVTQIREKPQNLHRTGTDFYSRNNINLRKGRQYSAQDNIDDTFKGILNINTNKIENNNKENNNNKVKTSIDNNKNKKEKKFNKTYYGFNLKKNNKEKRKKEKIIFLKIIKYFNKKSNYLWMRYYNKKRKNKYINETENTKKNKSFDNFLIKNNIKAKIKYHKRKYNKKNGLKYNTDNSEIDEIKEYKKYQKNFKNSNSGGYENIIRAKKYCNEDDKNDLSSESENTNAKKSEPKFKGIFDDNNNNNYNKNNDNTNNNINGNDTKNNQYKNKINEKRRFNFNTTSNFYNKNNNFNNYNYNQNEKNNDDNKNSKDEEKKFKDDFDKEKKNRFNIENIINNVIENNKRAAAARSSTSFYNIGSHFMNNHMRSTKTKFYNPKENRGGGFTGTKDSNFTKEQANEGKFNKPNSLKLTLINPINWRKHEEIWDNLVSLSLGLVDLEKYLIPPNETDVLISSYLKMNPRILNFCSIQKINTSNTKNESNFISFMVDDNIQNPKQEIKKWKEAYKKVVFRWHPDKLYPILEEVKLKNEQQKNELKKKSALILNNTNTLYKSIIEILNKILLAKNDKDNNNNI